MFSLYFYHFFVISSLILEIWVTIRFHERESKTWYQSGSNQITIWYPSGTNLLLRLYSPATGPVPVWINLVQICYQSLTSTGTNLAPILIVPTPPQANPALIDAEISADMDSVFLVNRYWSPSFEREEAGWDQILAKNHKFDEIHVDLFRERHFIRIKKANAKKISKGLRWGWEGISTGHLPLRGGGYREGFPGRWPALIPWKDNVMSAPPCAKGAVHSTLHSAAHCLGQGLSPQLRFCQEDSGASIADFCGDVLISIWFKAPFSISSLRDPSHWLRVAIPPILLVNHPKSSNTNFKMASGYRSLSFCDLW